MKQLSTGLHKICFSVIIPTYHRNDLLAKCLDRLAPGVQILSAALYEVIVTDDGYQTTAEKMIRDRYPWVKWVVGLRKGPAANRNNGTRYAKGEWLVFTDDDCLPSASWLLNFAEAITPDRDVYEGKTTCNAGIRSPLEHAPINLTGGYLWSCNMMIRVSLFHNLGGFDENFPYPHMEDVDLRERIKLNGCLIKFVDNAVIDHPPQKNPLGYQLGAMHESEFYYWYQKKHQQLSASYLLISVIKGRLRLILKCPKNRVTILAIYQLIIEFIYVIMNANKWKKKYRIKC